MPEVTGAELHEKLSSWEYSMPVIFLSAYGDVPAAAKAMKRGAVDFLTKPVDRADLNDAIRAALALDADNRRGLTISGVSRKLVARLTQREHEVMTYVIAGWRNKAVAKELGIAEDTVKVHRRRVMRKLEVDSVAELVRVCERAGIGPAQAHE
jgi:FixJ family two-component response regulator